MQKELLAFCVTFAIVVTILNGIAIVKQRGEIAQLRADFQNQVATQRATIAQLNASIADTNDRLTFLAEKLNPIIGAECRVDQIFNTPKDVPKDYRGYVFVVFDFPKNEYFGLGVICR